VSVAIVTGSSGLVGGEAIEFLAQKFDVVIGIDNNMRSIFFGTAGDTHWNKIRLKSTFSNFKDCSIDIRDFDSLKPIFADYNKDIKLIIHAAAQPSHDWAAKAPLIDFGINAMGTLNLLELARQFSPGAVFIFASTNKVYGDLPNKLPLVEYDKRWDLDLGHPFFEGGIDETMSIDQSKHSVFGASKVAADIMVQEYGRYFGLNTGIFRCGCLSGPNHSGVQLHGFLSYLVKCLITDTTYVIYGHKGKQVRDNIHSHDLIQMFWQFYLNPRPGEVYNAGGGRFSNCSILEAIDLCQKIFSKKLKYQISDSGRNGDHVWYISNLSKFKSHYPSWSYTYGLKDTLIQIFESVSKRQ
jgi:CDP-paratose 2-epimerase